MLTRDQVRMARTALRWTIKDLAEHAGITPQTVTRFENGANATRLAENALEQSAA